MGLENQFMAQLITAQHILSPASGPLDVRNVVLKNAKCGVYYSCTSYLQNFKFDVSSD